MKATYVRVSTDQQNITLQLESKKDGEIYWDKISRTVAFEDRPNGSAGRLMPKLGSSKRSGSYSIDCLGQDAINVLQNIKRFTKLGVNVKSKKKGSEYPD